MKLSTKRLLLLLMLIGLCVVPVLGIKENFQDWNSGDISANGLFLSGNDVLTVGNTFSAPLQPTAFSYFAYEDSVPFAYGQGQRTIYLKNAAGTTLQAHAFNTPSGSRFEIKIDAVSIKYYRDGVLEYTGAAIGQNPQFVSGDVYCSGFGCSSAPMDNFVLGETDHHITGSLPSNWSIQRDLLNPAATGVYAWNPATSEWVLKNSYNFYVDADKEFLNPEVLSIRHSGGTVINATTLTPVHNQVQYNLAQFLATSTSVGTTVPDGQYSVSWDEMSPPNWFADTFWVISNGGVVSWDQHKYSQSSTATISYTYQLLVTDVYGVTKATIPINTKTGSTTVTLAPETYPAGVYNVLLEATTISDSSVHIMNYDSMEVTGYIYFTGTVLNAENVTPLSGVLVNVSQGTTSLETTSIAGGLWNNTGNWLTGTPIRINATLTGYETYSNTFTPLIAKTVNITIPMMPTVKTCTGVCMGGLVQDSVYGNPITGATYHVKNGTEYTSTTNIAGYARVDNLNTLLYDVWSTRTGYANSTIAQKLAVGVR
jgi:hypothetical protein